MTTEVFIIDNGHDYIHVDTLKEVITILRSYEYITADNEIVNEKYPDDKDFLDWCYNEERYYYTEFNEV